MRLRARLAALSILVAPILLPAGAAFAKDYYVAPLGTVLTCTADGSQACPFASIDTAFASKKLVGGDVMLLMDGNFGGVSKVNAAFDSQVTIQSLNGSNARISYIHFDDAAKNIRLKNLKIWRDDGDVGTSFTIRAYSGASYLTFENLDIRSRADSTNYQSWTASRYLAEGTTAMDLRGSYFVVRNCTLTGVRGGIYVGQNALVENNIVDGFSEDGMKGVSGSTFRGNLVKNIVGVLSDYHSDGFQSYTPSDPITNLVLENNMIIQWTNDPASPLKGSVQGIGMFDGWYDNLIIRNNVVVTDHYHGISVYGTRGAKILNNTVVSLSGLPNTSPWIMVSAKKDDTPSQNVLLANNLAMAFTISTSTTYNIVAVSNSVILDPAQVFTDIKTFNYRPKTTSGFLDTADASDAPLTDILGAARPYGAGPDRGAYEVGGTSGSTSGDATTGGTTTDGGGTTSGGTTSGGTTTDGSGTTTGGTTSGGTTTDGSGTTTGGTTSGGTTTDGSGTTTGGTTSGGTTTTDGSGTTTGGSGNVKGWAAKFLKPPKK